MASGCEVIPLLINGIVVGLPGANLLKTHTFMEVLALVTYSTVLPYLQ